MQQVFLAAFTPFRQGSLIIQPFQYFGSVLCNHTLFLNKHFCCDLNFLCCRTVCSFFCTPWRFQSFGWNVAKVVFFYQSFVCQLLQS
ncbi:hypothetical protein Peur_042283 [Populus x canadensis]